MKYKCTRTAGTDVWYVERYDVNSRQRAHLLDSNFAFIGFEHCISHDLNLISISALILKQERNLYEHVTN